MFPDRHLAELPPCVEEFHQVGREYFARAPRSDIWVEFGDLPDETRDRLWNRHNANLMFPSVLRGMGRYLSLQKTTGISPFNSGSGSLCRSRFSGRRGATRAHSGADPTPPQTLLAGRASLKSRAPLVMDDVLTALDTFRVSSLEPVIRPAIAIAGRFARPRKRRTGLGSRPSWERQRALPQKRYGVVYADPPWRFEPYSRITGMDRAVENHYPTSPLAEIKALQLWAPSGRRSLERASGSLSAAIARFPWRGSAHL